jgi:hypothetical protein
MTALEHYATRAQAIAATIPVSVEAIEITRYATGYPLSYATYIPGTSGGPLAFQEAGGHWWELDTSSGMVNALWFGARGDDSTDNQTAFDATRAYAVAHNLTMGIPDGIYRHSGKNVWGYEKLKIHALGSQVRLKHTGSGVANEFSGIALYPGSQGAAGGVFGGPNRIILDGNASTTNLVLVDNWHFGDMKIAGRNATNAIFFCQNTGIVGASAVESTFDIKISLNYTGASTTIPLFGIRATSLAACTFTEMVVESVGNVAGAAPGVSLVNCIGNVFYSGTVESCLAGGMSISAGCSRNTFINVHCEVNGSQQDWTIAGSNNTFICCAGAGTASGQYLSGSYNNFIACNLEGMAVQPGAIENNFDRTTVLTAFADGGTRTSVDATTLVIPKQFRRGSLTIEADTAIPAGGTAGAGLKMSSTTNFGVFFGSGMPTLAAAQGSIYMRTDGGGPSSRMYINTNGSTAWTPVTTAI